MCLFLDMTSNYLFERSVKGKGFDGQCLQALRWFMLKKQKLLCVFELMNITAIILKATMLVYGYVIHK